MLFEFSSSAVCERDNIEFPTQGSTFIWNSTFSGGFLGGNEDYYKNEFTFKWYNQIFDKFFLENFERFYLSKEAHPTFFLCLKILNIQPQPSPCISLGQTQKSNLKE